MCRHHRAVVAVREREVSTHHSSGMQNADLPIPVRDLHGLLERPIGPGLNDSVCSRAASMGMWRDCREGIAV